MNNFAELPRELVKCIVSKMDMDTRIKMGLIFKLKVPTAISEHISEKLQIPEQYPGFSIVKLRVSDYVNGETQKDALYTFIRTFELEQNIVQTTYLQFYIRNSRMYVAYAQTDSGHEFCVIPHT